VIPISRELLVTLLPECTNIAEAFVEPFNEVFERFDINSLARQSAFLSQVGHESVRLLVLSEVLNYSVKGLLRVFPQFFTTDQAIEYAHSPLRIASRVYAGRRGNRDEASTDGWIYRGRGLFPIRGAVNYRKCGESLLEDPKFFLGDPDRLAEPIWAVRSAAWLWDTQACNTFADEDTEVAFKRLTRHINGGTHGLQDRMRLWHKSRELLTNQLPWTPIKRVA